MAKIGLHEFYIRSDSYRITRIGENTVFNSCNVSFVIRVINKKVRHFRVNTTLVHNLYYLFIESSHILLIPSQYKQDCIALKHLPVHHSIG